MVRFSRVLVHFLLVKERASETYDMIQHHPTFDHLRSRLHLQLPCCCQDSSRGAAMKFSSTVSRSRRKSRKVCFGF